MKDASSEISNRQEQQQQEIEKDEVKDKIHLISKNQKNYIKKILDNLLENSNDNASIICDYIISEQNEINIKESTKEGKIKVLLDLLKFLNYKSLKAITKNDLLLYLNKYRKTDDEDPTHKWIGTWNNRHMILLKFFRWLFDSDNPDIKNRKTPQCMLGVKRLTKKEIRDIYPQICGQPENVKFFKISPFQTRHSIFILALDTACVLMNYWI